jgi:adenosylcobinamide-GDP ribazoletransferase
MLLIIILTLFIHAMKEESSTDTAPSDGESRTTVLSPGIVESRNQTNRTQISAEIKEFLAGTSSTTNGRGGGIFTALFKSEFRTFFTIWMFITRLPSPSWIDLHPGYLMRGMSYFPVAGSILGLMYAIVFDFADVSLDLPSSIAASFLVSMGLYITGCFHEDGLADSADGLGGGWSKSQILKIMTDSRVGTFGCAALGMFLLMKVQLLGRLGTSHWQLFECSGAGPAIVVSQTVARLSAPYLIRTRDYIAEVGPKSPFYIFMVEAKYLVSWGRLAIATSFSLAVACVVYGPLVSTILITMVLFVAHLAGNKGDYLLGGVMGDFLGSTICVCEISTLTLISAMNGIIDTYISIRDELFDGGFKMFSVYENSRIRAMFHFVLLLLALKGWLTSVGPLDMYDREEDTNSDEKNKKK